MQNDSYFSGKRKKRVEEVLEARPFIRILERGGRVLVSIVQDVSIESLKTETVKRVRRGSIV